MSKRDEERGRFIERLRAEGVPEHVTRLVMRHATTLQRLAEAECSIDVGEPRHYASVQESNGRTTACGETLLVEEAPRHGVKTTKRWGLVTCWSCQSTRVERRVTALLKPFAGVEPIFNGDPRGAVVKLRVPSGSTDDWGREGLCVP